MGHGFAKLSFKTRTMYIFLWSLLTSSQSKVIILSITAQNRALNFPMRWWLMKIFLLLFTSLFYLANTTINVPAQIQIGTVRGTVVDESEAPLHGAPVSLHHTSTGSVKYTLTDHDGEFILSNCPLGTHHLKVSASKFQAVKKTISLNSNIPVNVIVTLKVAGSKEQIVVETTLSPEREATSTETSMSSNLIQKFQSRGNTTLQDIITTAPGWSFEDNGIIHSRGIDDGFLFVNDGIPIVDRMDSLSSAAIDFKTIRSIRIISGHIPAEYGSVSGGVIDILSNSGIDLPLGGSLSLGAGNFRTGEAAYAIRGSFKQKLGFYFSNSLGGSLQRFLDPVDPRNFNNRGGILQLSIRSDWHPTEKDVFWFNASTNGSDFRVTNTFEQELADQRRQQSLRDNHQSVNWQHLWSTHTVTTLAWYKHSYRSILTPGANPRPLSVQQFRKHGRQGLVFNATDLRGKHKLQIGIDVQRITPDELFSFFITDIGGAQEAGLRSNIFGFNSESPFSFQEAVSEGQVGWYVQDIFSPLQNLTISAGLRFDKTWLAAPDSGFSPRLGSVYYIQRTKTSIRGSYNKLFRPPQVENLLISSSEKARQLSIFTTPEGDGGTSVPPERQHTFEVGFAQAIYNLMKFDIAYWWKFVRNYGDPNLFYGTDLSFPNAIASGEAKGLDIRLEIPQKRGWSAWISYCNSSVFQIGPVTGGLFLEDHAIEIGPGTRFIPDHDQRNVGTFGLSYHHRRSGFWATLSGSHGSGTPIEVEEEEIEKLSERPGADLVNFDRQRVKPRTILDVSVGKDLFVEKPVTMQLHVDILNLTNSSFAYNFGNPFSGTHFGHPRLWNIGLNFTFH